MIGTQVLKAIFGMDFDHVLICSFPCSKQKNVKKQEWRIYDFVKVALMSYSFDTAHTWIRN